MTWLTEDPFWAVALAACALLVILLIMFATGHWALWKPAAGVVLLALAVVVVERLVVTDREQVELVIDQAVQAALHNDMPGIEALIEPQANQLRRQIRSELAHARITQLRVTHEVVRVDHNTVPPTAEADLIVRLSAQQGRGPIEDAPPIALKVQFSKSTGAWLVRAAEIDDFRSALGHKPH
ncbi:MAG TPA: hypothetical protein VHY91_20815 [Pirellulales bacterium]|jgi:hypothetical protein|nr:hypothetical protein [Pirellulales bacterium]HEX4145955.1 hypothetical protein [Pirellulales bacterium]